MEFPKEKKCLTDNTKRTTQSSLTEFFDWKNFYRKKGEWNARNNIFDGNTKTVEIDQISLITFHYTSKSSLERSFSRFLFYA